MLSTIDMTASLLINDSTREILKTIGKKGQTYDQIIRELIEKKNRLDFIESKSIRISSMEPNQP